MKRAAFDGPLRKESARIEKAAAAAARLPRGSRLGRSSRPPGWAAFCVLGVLGVLGVRRCAPGRRLGALHVLALGAQHVDQRRAAADWARKVCGEPFSGSHTSR